MANSVIIKKMKKKKYYTVETFPKSNRKKLKINTPNTNKSFY